VKASSDDLDYFLQPVSADFSFEKHLGTFCRIDDHDVMATIKNWSRHPDKILATLCRSLVERNLLKVKLQAEPFDKTWVIRKEKKPASLMLSVKKNQSILYLPGKQQIQLMIPAMNGSILYSKTGR
jgi:hypothetical protein